MENFFIKSFDFYIKKDLLLIWKLTDKLERALDMFLSKYHLPHLAARTVQQAYDRRHLLGWNKGLKTIFLKSLRLKWASHFVKYLISHRFFPEARNGWKIELEITPSSLSLSFCSKPSYRYLILNISFPPTADLLAPGRRRNDKSYARGRRQAQPITLLDPPWCQKVCWRRYLDAGIPLLRPFI